jgi:hypothetical protein
MKNTILILCFIAFSATLFAQNPRIEMFGDRRIETYQYIKGGDSIRFTIRGKKDTIKTALFYRSGKFEKIFWKQDSCYRFDKIGRIILKSFSFKNDDFTLDNSVSFYPNGQMLETKSFINNVKLNDNFAENGRLLLSSSVFYTSKGRNYRISDRNGVLITSDRSDTIVYGINPIVRYYDTAYFANGHVYKTEIKEDYAIIAAQYYDENGALTKTLLPDSLQLIIFKDNVDCYYGLKNSQGDTLFKPRFDRIDKISNLFFVTYVGESASLFKLNGEPITPPTPHLTGLSELNGYYNFATRVDRQENIDIIERQSKIDTTMRYFSFSEGNKHGAMTEKLDILMPPQYLHLTDHSLNMGNFFLFENKKGNSLISRGYLTRQGKTLFNTPIKAVSYTNDEDYFELNTEIYQFDSPFRTRNYIMPNDDGETDYYDYNNGNTKGLGKSDGSILLSPNFYEIRRISNAPLFMASLFKRNEQTKMGVLHEGIFNTETKRWILDTTSFRIKNKINQSLNFFVIKHLTSKKYGIMDTTGGYILPLNYDSIGIADDKNGLFWVKNDEKYQIFEAKIVKPFLHTAQYDFLELISFQFYNNNLVERAFYFLAKRNGKWGLIDSDEKVIKPFEYDYASTSNGQNGGFFLIKNNQAAYFDLTSLPNEADFPVNKNKINSYSLIDNFIKIFFLDNTGKVVIPPQYELYPKTSQGSYTFVQDSQRRKKLIFDSGDVIDYPFKYSIGLAEPKCRVIAVWDSTRNSCGMVSTNGKILVPLQNYGVAIGDVETSTFFVKRDTPLVNRYSQNEGSYIEINPDTLNPEDTDWLMYDFDGKLLTTQPFRFAINFRHGVGVGMQGDHFNLYKTDGSILKPFVAHITGNKNIENAGNTEGEINGFNNIRRDPNLGYYALFYNQGLTPSMILTKKNGEILVNGGHYDGISQFYGKYALVSSAGKVGLIDSLGHEIIAPKDLRTYTGHFMDSLAIWVKFGQFKNRINLAFKDTDKDKLPIYFEDGFEKLHPDSLKLNAELHATLWNLLLEKSPIGTFLTASDISIPRVWRQIDGGFCGSTYVEDKSKRFTRRIIPSDKTIAFCLATSAYTGGVEIDFYNFYRRNNRWEDIQINELLQIQGEKRWEMNDLITKKVKALKNQQIDCSNASAFITTVENRWMLTKEGIDFCFDSSDGGREFVIISFTWTELAPFLKMKIF